MMPHSNFSPARSNKSKQEKKKVIYATFTVPNECAC